MGPARPSREGVALITDDAARGAGRALPAPGGDRRGPRRGRTRRGHRLAADPRALRAADGLAPNPMVTLNHAVALAMVARAAGRPRPARHARRRRAHGRRTIALDAVRAHLLEMAGEAAARERATERRRGARRASPNSATWRDGRLGCRPSEQAAWSARIGGGTGHARHLGLSRPPVEVH